MYREYSDKRIYRDAKIAVILTAIGLIVSLIIVSLDIVSSYIVITTDSSDYLGSQRLYVNRFFDRLYNRVINEAELNQLDIEITIYYIFLIAIPIWVYISACRGEMGVEKGVKIDQGRTIVYDTSGWTNAIIVSLIPIFVMLIDVIRYFIDKSYHFPNWPALCGGLFVPHCFIYIAEGFLRHAKCLIKKELINSIDYIKEKQAENERKTQEEKQKKDLKDSIQAKKLLADTGKIFFINYYDQLKKYNTIDVIDIINENYSEESKKRRIVSAKKIFSLNIQTDALKIIVQNEDGVASQEIIDKAKSLLEKEAAEQALIENQKKEEQIIPSCANCRYDLGDETYCKRWDEKPVGKCFEFKIKK